MAKLLEPETVLSVEYKGTRYEATVQTDGTILFEQEVYKTLSVAALAVTTKHGVIHWPNSWDFKDSDGTAKPLKTLRGRYWDEQAAPAIY